MKPFDLPKAIRTRNGNDILPFLISLQNVLGYPRKASDKIAMLIYFPHDENVLYYIEYVNGVVYVFLQPNSVITRNSQKSAPQ